MADAKINELKEFLTKSEVPPSVYEFLIAQNVKSIDAFANCCRSADHVETRVVGKIQALKDDLGAIGYTVQAWREAVGWNEKQLDKKRQGLAPESLDDPLPEPIDKHVRQVFTAHYKWRITLKNFGSPSLLGRVKREFDAKAPSMFAVSRVRSGATCHGAQTVKRSGLADDLELTRYTHQDEPELKTANDSKLYLLQLRVLVNTWGLAGCFDVSWEKEDIKYCHWQEACEYFDNVEEFADELMQYPHDIVSDFLKYHEEKTRGKAIQMALEPSLMPWGKALEAAWKENLHLWRDGSSKIKKNCRATNNQPAHVPEWEPLKQTGGGSTADGGRKSSVASSSQAVSRAPPSIDMRNPSNWKRATQLNGMTICKQYNSGSCTVPGKPCPKGNLNVCDIVVKGGKTCGAKSHSAKGHEIKHGQPEPKGQ